MVRAIFGILFFALLIFALTPFGLAYVYLRYSGASAPGQVLWKRESIVMPSAEAWGRVFEVAYRFRPADSAKPEIASESVSREFYDAVRPGASVEVRYAPQGVRALHLQYVGSILAENSWRSRLPSRSDDRRGWLEIAAIALMALLGWMAYSAKSHAIGWIAAFWAAAVCSGILPFGAGCVLIVFAGMRKPALRTHGYVFALAAGLIVGTGIMWLRLPRPAPPVSGPAEQGTAAVTRVREVGKIWSIGRRSSGQSLRRPFDMVDLEIARAGAEPVHAVDRLDIGSVPGLVQGATVPVVYAAGDPRSAQIVGATRTYAQDAMAYFLEIEYGLGIPIAIALWLLITLPQTLFNRLTRRVLRGP